MEIYQIHLKTLSYITITKRIFNILYQTELFIPAWTMWNAFVKLYALENKTAGKIDYMGAQNKLKQIRLTNFYIKDKDKIINPFKKDKDFDKRDIVSSDLKTAIDVLSNTSLEGALYEREYLKAKEFVGWVKCDDLDLKEFFSEKIKDKIIFIGADKNAGFGKVKIERIIGDKDNFLKANGIIDQLREANYVSNHVSNHVSNDKTYLIPPEMNRKDYFPLVLRMWDEEKGDGLKIEVVAK